MYILELHDKNCLIQLFRSSNTCLFITINTKQCRFQLGVYCNSVSCSACICSSSCLITALSVSAVCVYIALPAKRSANQTQHVPILAVCAVPFHLPTVCINKRSSLPLGTYSALPLNSSLPLYFFRNICKPSAHPNKQFKLSVLQLLTALYYTWY